MTQVAVDARAGVSISEVARGEWDELLARFPDRTVYHTLAWIETVEECHGARPVLLKATADGECVGVWPCLEVRKGPLRVVGSPLPGWSTAYMGPLFAERVDVGRVLRAFVKDRRIGRASYVECRVVDERCGVDMSEFGFERRLRFETYVMDLGRAEEDVWAGLDSSCRNKIRKAEKAGITVQRETSAEWVGDFWAMSVEVFLKSDRRPGYDERFLATMWERLAREEKIAVYSAVAEGARLSTIVVLQDDQTAYYWGGASYGAHLKKAPNNLALWEAIRGAAGRGLKRFDFVSSKGGPGVFKKSFGPEAREVATHWARSRSPLEGMIKRGYERYLRWRRSA